MTGDFEITTILRDNALTIQASSLQSLTEALALLAEIDLPNSSPPTSWVALQHADSDQAAKYLQNFLAAEGKDLTVTPDSRSNRIFLMGLQKNIDWAHDWLKKADRP